MRNDKKNMFADYIDNAFIDLDLQILEMEKDPSINSDYLEIIKLLARQARQSTSGDCNVKTYGDNPMRQDITICPNHGCNRKQE